MRRLIPLVATLSLVIILSPIMPADPAAAGISAAGVTRVHVQNLDSTSVAASVIDVYRSGGALVESVALPPIPPQQASTVDLGQTNLPTGAYAGIVAADRDVGARAEIWWPTSGGAVVYGETPPDTDVFVPYIARNLDGQSSLVSIQNMDESADATVSVAVRAADDPAPAAQAAYQIPPGSSTTLDLSQDIDWTVLGDDFVGSLQVTAQTEVAVVSFIDVFTSQKAVYGIEGVPASDANDELLAPLFFSALPVNPSDSQSVKLDSRIAVMNTSTSPADVSVEYWGTGGGPACAGQQFVGPLVTIEPLTMAVFGSRAAANLPENCVGSARIRAVGGDIVASVLIRTEAHEVAAGYLALHPDRAADAVLFPQFRKATDDLTGWIGVMNVGPANTKVEVNFGDPSDAPLQACSSCGRDVSAGSASSLWLGDAADLPVNGRGELVLQASQPLVAAMVDVPVGLARDMTAETSGRRVPTGPPARVVDLLPFLMNAGRGPGFATPTPANPPTATPVGPPSTPTPTAIATDTPISTPTLPATSTPVPPGATDTPAPTDTPVPPGPTDTPMPPGPTSTPAASPTPVGAPTATAVTGGPDSPEADPGVAGRVPPAVVAAALANPSAIAGWGQLRNPGLRHHPIFNPYRTCLTLLNTAVPYHPLFNPVVFKAGCG